MHNFRFNLSAFISMFVLCGCVQLPIIGTSENEVVRERELLFDSKQWGNHELVAKQNSAARQVQSILSNNPNFERLSSYRNADRLRRISKPVGRLDVRFNNGNFITCTGTIISKKLLLTNHHCVPGSGEHGVVTEVQFLLGYYSSNNSDLMQRVSIKVDPIDSDQNLDYSVLEADTEFDKQWGYAKLSNYVPENGDSLLLIHHPGGSEKHVTRGKCRAGRTSPYLEFDVLHRCDSLPGSSGAPLFLDNTGEMVAIHYAGSPIRGPDAFNYAKQVKQLSEIDPSLKQLTSLANQAGLSEGINDSSQPNVNLEAPVVVNEGLSLHAQCLRGNSTVCLELASRYESGSTYDNFRRQQYLDRAR